MSTAQTILLWAVPAAVLVLAIARAAIRSARAKREASASDDSEACPREQEPTDARR